MDQKFFWRPGNDGHDIKRYVEVCRDSTGYLSAMKWLDTQGIDRQHWDGFPVFGYDGRSKLGFYFNEPISLDTVMLFKLTWA